MLNRLLHLMKWLCLILLLFAFRPAMAQEAKRDGIVVWKLEAKGGVTEENIDLISGFITAQVEKFSGSKVISEADIMTIIKGEQTKQVCGTEDAGCMAEIGAALGVPEAVSGDLGKFGSFFMVNLRRINLRKAEVIKRSSHSIEGDRDDLIRALPAVVAELFDKSVDDTPVAIPAPKKEPSTTAVLMLITKPEGGMIFIDGEKAGAAPLELTLPAGERQLKVEMDGYVTVEKQQMLEAGGKLALDFELVKAVPGTLLITSIPDGAGLLLDGKEIGATPMEAELPEGEYTVEATMEGYKKAESRASIISGETFDLELKLEKIYPMNPYKLYGHVCFWTGLGLAAFGGVATFMSFAKAADYNEKLDGGAKSASQGWMGAAWAGYGIGGALMITGAVLWGLSPGDKAWAEQNAVGLAPTPDGGGMISVSGRW